MKLTRKATPFVLTTPPALGCSLDKQKTKTRILTAQMMMVCVCACVYVTTLYILAEPESRIKKITIREKSMDTQQASVDDIKASMMSIKLSSSPAGMRKTTSSQSLNGG